MCVKELINIGKYLRGVVGEMKAAQFVCYTELKIIKLRLCFWQIRIIL